jgi:hypothetical protein
MRRSGVSLPPEAIWLGESWEDAPARRRRAPDAPVGTVERARVTRPEASPRSRAATASRPATTSRPGATSRAAAASPRPAASRAATASRAAAASPRASASGAVTTPPAATRSRAGTPPRTAAPERRTVTIRGRGAERDLTWTAHQARRRPTRPVHERPGFKPDRAAMWAVMLGILLVLVAATSSHAAVRSAHKVHPRPAAKSAGVHIAAPVSTRPPA